MKIPWHFLLVAGCVTAAFTGVSRTSAQPVISNPSFEEGATPPSPGYGFIQGWVFGSADAGYGINEGGGPFADNGTVPHGTQAGFIQDNGKLSQAVAGFTLGEECWITYRENARGLCCGEREATLTVRVDNAIVVPTHTVQIVGGDNPYRLLTSAAFVAAEPSVMLTFEKGGFGDSTALIDDVRIFSRDAIRLNITLTNGNVPVIGINGVPGKLARLEFKNALTAGSTWQILTNVILGLEPTLIVDSPATNSAPRFYRVDHAR